MPFSDNKSTKNSRPPPHGGVCPACVKKVERLVEIPFPPMYTILVQTGDNNTKNYIMEGESDDH
jgi:hypothetical protein